MGPGDGAGVGAGDGVRTHRFEARQHIVLGYAFFQLNDGFCTVLVLGIDDVVVDINLRFISLARRLACIVHRTGDIMSVCVDVFKHVSKKKKSGRLQATAQIRRRRCSV